MQFDLSHLSINRDDLEFTLNDPIAAPVEQTDIHFQDMDTRNFLNKTLLDAINTFFNSICSLSIKCLFSMVIYPCILGEDSSLTNSIID